MKHFFRDLYIWTLDVSGILNISMKRLQKKNPLVRIVVFHDVPDEVWFDEVLQYLSKNTHVLTPDDFYARRFDAGRINTLLTFDDGYASWVSVVLPALQKYGYSGIFFLNSGLLNVSDDAQASDAFFEDRLRITPKPPLTWDGARVLLASGHRIGGHTVSHPVLSSCTYEAGLEEIRSDKARIESELSTVIEDFAYPFGTAAAISPEATLAAKDAGYLRAYTAESGFMSLNGELCMIPRMCLEKSQSITSIDRWMRGGFDLFTKIKHSI